MKRLLIGVGLVLALSGGSMAAQVTIITNLPNPATRIKDVKIGQTVYTQPWAFDYTTQELKDDYSTTSAPDGTSSLKITKLPDGTFSVDFSTCPWYKP